MKITLSLQNLLPVLVLKRRDFLGVETQENLHEHGRIKMVNALVAQDSARTEHIFLQLETVPSDVEEMVLKLCKNADVSASWSLSHGERWLHGGIIVFSKPLGLTGFRMVETSLPRDSELATVVFKRSPLRFDSQGRAMARTWSIYNLGKIGTIWDNCKSVSESDPDLVPAAG